MLPKKVTIVEVSPRDGLEGVDDDISVDFKIELIERCLQAGITVIEAGGFFSNNLMPALKNTQEVLKKINHNKNVRLICLVDNMQSLNAALNANAKEITVFTAASESYSQDIVICNIDESLKAIERMVILAKESQLKVRGAISVALGCPYEGTVDPNRVANIANCLCTMGCDEIVLGDSHGLGDPKKVENVIRACIAQDIPVNKISLHFHNTYGMALVNIYAGLMMGVSLVESAVGGLGGRSNGSNSGNVATEDLVYMLKGLNIESNVNLDTIIEVGKFACNYLKRPINSCVSLPLTLK